MYFCNIQCQSSTGNYTFDEGRGHYSPCSVLSYYQRGCHMTGVQHMSVLSYQWRSQIAICGKPTPDNSDRSYSQWDRKRLIGQIILGNT